MAQDKTTPLVIFGRKLRQFRKLARLSQQELSDLLGYSPNSSSISQAESGIKGMQQEKLFQLSEILGVDIAILMSQDEYTDDEADMIYKFYRLIKDKNNPHRKSIKALLDSSVS